MNRRTVLARVGTIGATVVAAGAVAGCLDGGAGGDSGTGDDGTGNGTTEFEIETLESDCGTTDTAAVDVGNGTVTVEGVISAPNPCHEAVLLGDTTADGVLTVRVGVESDDEDACIECIGRIEYRLSIGFGDDRPETLVVEHEGVEETAVVREELEG